jgi:hypothetical protein
MLLVIREIKRNGINRQAASILIGSCLAISRTEPGGVYGRDDGDQKG